MRAGREGYGIMTQITIGDERCELVGKYMAETGDTVRGTAKKFGISKSTVHKDITEKLQKQNRSLYLSVKDVLDKNKSERHLRGGEATRQKYIHIKNKIP